MTIDSSTFGGTKLTSNDALAFLRQSGMAIAGLPEQEFAAQKMAATSQGIYREPPERAALRCALGDAAHLCDALARDIENLGRRRKTVNKKHQEMAAVARRCGDAIWKMRDLIEVPQP